MPANPIRLEPSRDAPYVGLAFYGMGLLIDAKRAELISAIADLLEALGQSGFRIDPKLFDAALALTGE